MNTLLGVIGLGGTGFDWLTVAIFIIIIIAVVIILRNSKFKPPSSN